MLVRNYVFEMRDGPDTKLVKGYSILPRPKVEDEEVDEDENKMDVDGEESKEKKRKHKEAEVNGDSKKSKVCLVFYYPRHADSQYSSA